MTRKEWEKKTLRNAERTLGVPAGWWGTWGDLHGPNGQRVHFSRPWRWTISQNGKRISKHDSREYAIKKAAKL